MPIAEALVSVLLPVVACAEAAACEGDIALTWYATA